MVYFGPSASTPSPLKKRPGCGNALGLSCASWWSALRPPSLCKKRKSGLACSTFAVAMRNRIGADVESFFQTASPFQYLELLVPVGIEWCRLHGVIASVSHTLHHVQHHGMRTTQNAAFRSFFVAQIRDSGFGSLRRSLSTTNSKQELCCLPEGAMLMGTGR